MFYFSNTEIDSLLSSNNNDGLCSYFGGVFSKAHKQYKPLFFTPYHSVSEFAEELVAPIVHPLQLAGIAASSGITALIATAAALGGLLVSGIASLCMLDNISDKAVNFSLHAITMVGVGLMTAASCLFLSLVSIPHGLASLVTRTVTTAFCKKEEQVTEDSIELASIRSTQ